MTIGREMFSYDEVAKNVRSTDPNVEIIALRREGGSDYRACVAVLRYAGSVYCIRAPYDFLRDSDGNYVVTEQRNSAGIEFTDVNLRATYRNSETGALYSSTFENTSAGRSQAVDLAIAFLASARMFPDLPVKKISFRSKQMLVSQVVEL